MQRTENITQTILRKMVPFFLFFFPVLNTSAQIKPDTLVIRKEKTVYDTVFIRDTIRITDTIFESGGIYRSAAIHGGISRPFMHWGSNSDALIKQNKQSVSNITGLSAGLDIRLDFDKWSGSLGLTYSDIRSDFSFSGTTWQHDTSYYYLYDSTLNRTIDTIDIYYQTDGEDTVTIYVIDTTENWQKDSTLTFTADSTARDSLYSFKNRIKYLHIPLVFYKPVLISDKHVLYLSAGIIGTIILSEDIMYITHEGIAEIHNQTIRFRPYLLAGINWEQYIGDYWSLELSANYRFNPLVKSVSVSSSINTSLRLRYYF